MVDVSPRMRPLVAAWLGSLQPAEAITADVWAERYRVLGLDESSVPGPYSLSLTPFARDILLDLSDDQHQMVGVMAGAQVCKSETGRNWLAWTQDIDPGPAMIVFPSEPSAKETIDERIIPMFRNTPRLGALLTGRAWDVKAKQVKLRSSRIYVAWASSAQTIATRPIRYLFLDEIDKYDAPDPGREGDSITLALLRITTYGERAKVFACSTPTNMHGPIYRMWLSSEDRRQYEVPCPFCGEHQILRWEQLRYQGYGSSSASDPATWRRIAGNPLEVAYECARCRALIPDAAKRDMVARGRWRSEGYPVGERPQSRTVVYQISSLYSPWVTWAQIVSEHYSARLQGRDRVHGWINGRLGWIAEDEESRIDPAQILLKAARGGPRGVVPAQACALISSADTQKLGWWWKTRAWSRDGESWLVGWGFARTFTELRAATLERRWPVEGLAPLRACALVLLIDAGGGGDDHGDGNLTDRVLRFAGTDPERIKPVKGAGGTTRPTFKLREAQSGKDLPKGVTLWLIDTGAYKDVLAAMILQANPEVWHETADADHEYARQMSSEHKVAIRQRDGRTVFAWVPISAGAANHLWDAGVYNLAGRDLPELELDERPTFAEESERLRAARAAAAERRARDEPPAADWDAAGWWSGSRSDKEWAA